MTKPKPKWELKRHPRIKKTITGEPAAPPIAPLPHPPKPTPLYKYKSQIPATGGGWFEPTSRGWVHESKTSKSLHRTGGMYTGPLHFRVCDFGGVILLLDQYHRNLMDLVHGYPLLTTNITESDAFHVFNGTPQAVKTTFIPLDGNPLNLNESNVRQVHVDWLSTDPNVFLMRRGPVNMGQSAKPGGIKRVSPGLHIKSIGGPLNEYLKIHSERDIAYYQTIFRTLFLRSRLEMDDFKLLVTQHENSRLFKEANGFVPKEYFEQTNDYLNHLKVNDTAKALLRPESIPSLKRSHHRYPLTATPHTEAWQHPPRDGSDYTHVDRYTDGHVETSVFTPYPDVKVLFDTCFVEWVQSECFVPRLKLCLTRNTRKITISNGVRLIKENHKTEDLMRLYKIFYDPDRDHTGDDIVPADFLPPPPNDGKKWVLTPYIPWPGHHMPGWTDDEDYCEDPEKYYVIDYRVNAIRWRNGGNYLPRRPLSTYTLFKFEEDA